MATNVIPLPKVDRKIAPFEFTKASINRAIADLDGAKNVTLKDTACRGLILRKQSRDWVLSLYRKIDGKVWRVKIDTYGPHTDLRKVRSEVESISTEIRNGTYRPREEKAAEARAVIAEEAFSLGAAFDLYQASNPHLRPATLERYAYGLLDLTGTDAPRDDAGRSDPIAGAKACRIEIGKLTAGEIRAAYDRLTDAGKIGNANSMLRSLRAIWNFWASETDFDGRNPVEKITRQRGRVKKIAPRTGALAPGERVGWYTALERLAVKRNTGTARALQLIFVTGLRRDEVLAMRWAEIEGDTILIPGERMKSGEPLRKPITREVRRILDAQREANPNSEWVFPASRGAGHIRDTRKTLAQMPTVVTNHDLRRGYIVAGALAMVPDVAVKMLVGHSVSDITATYAKAIESELPRLAQTIEDALLEGVVL